jgi:hypothetical protein
MVTYSGSGTIIGQAVLKVVKALVMLQNVCSYLPTVPHPIRCKLTPSLWEPPIPRDKCVSCIKDFSARIFLLPFAGQSY